jgi:hypothetical protein
MMKRERARAARAMATGMRVAGNEEGEGDKAMVMATRIAGEWTATATKRAMVMATRVAGKMGMATATKRMMATATMVAGNKEGNGNGGKSNGDGDKGGRQAN